MQENEENTDISGEMEHEKALQRLKKELGMMLLSKRDDAVEYRAGTGVERKWREAEILFDGMDRTGPQDMLDYATGEASRKDPSDVNRRSSIIVNIVRGRCETAEGRFLDILLPTDDKNWGLKTTPVPSMSDDNRPAMQKGQPATKEGKQLTMADVASDKRIRAKKAMKLMELEVEDQLNESDYNGEIRKMIRQAIRLGTGVMKGPNVVRANNKKWSVGVEEGKKKYTLDNKEMLKPSSEWVDCWNVYPSPGTTENVQRSAEYIFEKSEILPRDVRNLIGLKGGGYFDDELISVLKEAPKRTRAAYDKRHNSNLRSRTTLADKGAAYEQWVGYVDVEREHLKALGCQCKDDHVSYSAIVVFINDRIVKVELNTLDTGDMPYDFFQWTQVSTEDPWGIGVPEMMSWLQRAMTAAWRAMMDNSGDSAVQTIVLGKNLEPAPGQDWALGSTFISKDELDDARKAFAVFSVQNNQEHYQNIIELTLRFVDLETSLPTIFQGEMQEVPETLGATNIMVDSANVGLRYRVKLFDDRITRPHIGRYYHYNMAYNNNQEIKGDFNVDPRGISVLLEKDQQAQLLLQTFSLKEDPNVSRLVDWDKAATMFFASRRLDILKSEDDLKSYDEQQAEAQGQPADPRIEAVTIRVEGDMAKEELRQQSDMAELEFKAEQAGLDREHQAKLKQMDYEIQMMIYSEKKDIELDKLKTQLSISGQGMNLQKELATEKASVPQVTTPPTEPAGRAPVGQAYQR